MRIIDVVKFLDESGREIAHREPQGGPGDFRLGSQVIVRQSQVAVFFRDGLSLDTFGPGRHTLSTANLPILSGIIGLATNGRTPFPAEVVFVNMRQFIDQKWGTPEPIALRDPLFGMARLRTFGSYSFQVTDPTHFVNRIVGQQGKFTTAAVQDYLRSMIIQRFTETLGLGRSALYINAISPTEETSKAIEERSAMGAVGNLDEYMKFKAARAMGDAANNSSGSAGAGAGLGLGAGIGGGKHGRHDWRSSSQRRPRACACRAGGGSSWWRAQP